MPPSCTVSVRLKPGAKQEKIEIGEQGTLLAWVHAPPVEGKANAALIELLSDALDVPKSCVSILRGVASKNKVVSVTGLTKDSLFARIKG
jgi:hypothetical protein